MLEWDLLQQADAACTGGDAARVRTRCISRAPGQQGARLRAWVTSASCSVQPATSQWRVCCMRCDRRVAPCHAAQAEFRAAAIQKVHGQRSKNEALSGAMRYPTLTPLPVRPALRAVKPSGCQTKGLPSRSPTQVYVAYCSGMQRLPPQLLEPPHPLPLRLGCRGALAVRDVLGAAGGRRRGAGHAGGVWGVGLEGEGLGVPRLPPSPCMPLWPQLECPGSTQAAVAQLFIYRRHSPTLLLPAQFQIKKPRAGTNKGAAAAAGDEDEEGCAFPGSQALSQTSSQQRGGLLSPGSGSSQVERLTVRWPFLGLVRQPCGPAAQVAPLSCWHPRLTAARPSPQPHAAPIQARPSQACPAHVPPACLPLPHTLRRCASSTCAG